MSKFKVGDKVLFDNCYEAEIYAIFGNSESVSYGIMYSEPVLRMESTKYVPTKRLVSKNRLTPIE
jgi:hypothetical protein